MNATLPGIILLVIGAVNLYNEIRKRRSCNTLTNAVIVDVRRDRHVGSGTAYTPIVEFTAGEKKVRGDGGVLGAKRGNRYRIGDTVEILYNADRPEEFRVRGKNAVLIMSVFFLAFGIGVVLTAFLKP